MKIAQIGFVRTGLIVAGVASTVACTHRVEMIAPKDPIRIELAIKIDQEVRVRLEQDIEDLIAENPDLF